MALPESVLAEINPDYSRAKHAAEARWFQEQAELRIRQVRRAVQLYTPWLLPEFALLGVDSPGIDLPSNDLPGNALPGYLRPQSLPALDQMTGFIDRLADQLKAPFDWN